MHTIKPIDMYAIIRAARETRVILTIDEHQKGRFWNWISAVISENHDINSSVYLFNMMGTNYKFGENEGP